MNIELTKNISIGKNKRPIIVAEISSNHNSKKSLFLDHIVQAKKAGADMIKIQTYEPGDITLNERGKKFLITKGIWKGKYLWDLYQKAHTPFSWHDAAFLLGKKLKIPIFSTPFSIRAVDFLKRFNPIIYKVSSFEITDFALINHIAKIKKPIIISTGLSNYKEIDNAIKIITKYHRKIIILYCISGYPTPEIESNILTIKTFQKRYKNFHIGISDHTNDINSSLAATSLGATIIEKHFKISNKIKSLDSSFSINFNQLKELKLRSQKIFLSLGSSRLKMKKAEKNLLNLRRSIFAAKNIKKNVKIMKDKILVKRPKIGIGAENFFKIIGKHAKKNIKKNDPIFKFNIK